MNDIKGPGLANLNMPSITENKSPSKLSLEHKFSDAFRAAQGRLATGIAPASALPAFRLNPAPSAMAAKAQVRDDMALHERVLALRGYRQVLLASNIANADTPGYKSVDFDIYDALKKGLGPKEVQLLYDVPAQGSLDGNTVDLDVQRAKFAENAIMYEFAVEKVSEKHMMDLLKNLPY